MKKHFILLFFVQICLSAFSQELILHQYYHLNALLLNPASAGFSYQPEIKATFSKQWIGIAGAPSTQTISAQAGIGKGIGLATSLFNDVNGLNKETGVNLAASYQIVLGENDNLLNIRKLCFGLGLSGLQHTVNINEFTNHDYDPAVDGAEKKGILLNFGAGVYLRYDRIFVGISSANLGAGKLSIYDDATEPDISQNFFLNTGYLISINENIIVEPSVLLKINTDDQKKIDFNLKALYYNDLEKQYWMMLSLRRNFEKPDPQFLDLITLAGINYAGLMFAYAYDMGLSELKNSHSGSHQLMIGVQIKQKKKHKLACPVF